MKRTKIRWIVGVVIGLFIGFGTNAQDIDEKRMERDIEVSKNILQTLMKEGNEDYYWGNRIEGNYLEGYGVVFTFPSGYSFLYGYSGTPIPVIVKESRSWPRSQAGSVSVVPKLDELFEIRELTLDSIREVNNKYIQEQILIYYADYADLIGQLKPEERIKIQNKSNSSELFYFEYSGFGDVSASGATSGFSAEVQKKDITAYKSGKLTRSEFESKVVFEKSKLREKIQDLELFASIMRRLYSPDLTETFFTSNTPRYERMENYGAIFFMKTYSSYSEENLYRMPALGRSDVTSDERKEVIINMYPKFEKDLKINMIDYGRTISSLGSDEVLSLNVTLTRCKGCDIPKSIIATVSAGVLKDFNQGKITIEKAVSEVKVKKNMN